MLLNSYIVCSSATHESGQSRFLPTERRVWQYRGTLSPYLSPHIAHPAEYPEYVVLRMRSGYIEIFHRLRCLWVHRRKAFRAVRSVFHVGKALIPVKKCLDLLQFWNDHHDWFRLCTLGSYAFFASGWFAAFQSGRLPISAILLYPFSRTSESPPVFFRQWHFISLRIIGLSFLALTLTFIIE